MGSLSDETAEPPEPGESESLGLEHESHNLLVLAIYMVTLRFSWIFKTESVLIPRFMDAIGGSGFLRGWLPVLNRIGQSVPPMLVADALRRQPLKSRSLILTSIGMGVCFLSLAAVWFAIGEPAVGNTPGWMPIVFLVIYVAFFVVSGLNQLALGAVQGKLIKATRRGSLMGLSGVVGSVVSITLAWFLLQSWLEPPMRLPDSGYVLIFGFAGCGFMVAGLTALPLREQPDAHVSVPVRSVADSVRGSIGDAWSIFRTDASFRNAAVVAMLFITVQLLFPHFQAHGRRGMGERDEGFHLMLWVIAQNGAVGLFSLGSGWIADRFGNRLAIRIQVFLSALTPLMALLLIGTSAEGGHNWYWVSFVFLGLVPVTMKTFVNYTLELTEPDRHPRYVSTMSLSFAVPFVLSPVVGGMIDSVGFEPVFIAISLLVATGGCLTFRMSEPRQCR